MSDSGFLKILNSNFYQEIVKLAAASKIIAQNYSGGRPLKKYYNDTKIIIIFSEKIQF